MPPGNGFAISIQILGQEALAEIVIDKHRVGFFGAARVEDGMSEKLRSRNRGSEKHFPLTGLTPARRHKASSQP